MLIRFTTFSVGRQAGRDLTGLQMAKLIEESGYATSGGIKTGDLSTA